MHDHVRGHDDALSMGISLHGLLLPCAHASRGLTPLPLWPCVHPTHCPTAPLDSSGVCCNGLAGTASDRVARGAVQAKVLEARVAALEAELTDASSLANLLTQQLQQAQEVRPTRNSACRCSCLLHCMPS